MNLSYYVRIGCGAALAGLLAGDAFADISAFNAAVKAGNYKAAAAEAKGVWASWNPSDPDTATVAREFGFASYVSGDYGAARDYGYFLKDKGATLAKPDDQPATSRVLLAAASFRLAANDATRAELSEALKAREAAPGLDSMSMLASEALYKADWAAGRWRDAGASGMMAYRILSRGGDSLAARAFEARTTAGAGDFLGQRDKTDYDTMIDTHDAIIDAIDTAADPKRRQALVNLSFTAKAWAQSIFAFFDSVQQTGSSIPVRVKYREMKRPQKPFFDSGDGAAAEWCELEVNARAIDYPSSPLFNGMVGTVIVRLDLDENGRVSNAQTLAAVPAKHFSEAVMDAAPNFRFVRASKAAPGCSVARKDYVFTISFLMG